MLNEILIGIITDANVNTKFRLKNSIDKGFQGCYKYLTFFRWSMAMKQILSLIVNWWWYNYNLRFVHR